MRSRQEEDLPGHDRQLPVPVSRTPTASSGFEEVINLLSIADIANQDVIKTTLSAGNVNVIAARNGQEAMKILREGKLPHMVLLDVELSGSEVCKHLRDQINIFPAMVPVIMAISGKIPAARLCAEGLIAGGNYFVAKPYNPEDLLLHVRVAAEARKSHMTRVQQDRRSHLLEAALPKHVCRQLCSSGTSDAEDHDNVAVMCCKVTNWSSMSYTLGTRKTVEAAKKVLGIMETVGSAHYISLALSMQYPIVAVSGHDGNGRCLERLLSFITAMIQATHSICEEHKIEMAIGVHVGAVQAGVVGSRLPRYTLFGECLDIAQTIQSACPPGCIHISDPAKQQMGNATIFENASLTDYGETIIEHYGRVRTWVLVPPWQQTTCHRWMQKASKAKEAASASPPQAPPQAAVSRADQKRIAELIAEVEALQTKLQMSDQKISQIALMNAKPCSPIGTNGKHGHGVVDSPMKESDVSSHASTSNVAKVNEALKLRVNAMRKEVLGLRAELRTSNRDLVFARSELESMKEQAEDAWNQLLKTEELLAYYKIDCENHEDRNDMMAAWSSSSAM